MNNPKTILIVLFLCLCAGLVYFVKSNTVGNINRILSANSYRVIYNSCGCFGCTDDTLTIIKGHGGTTALLTYNQYYSLNHYVEKREKIVWNAAKENFLRTLFTNGIHTKNKYGCTTLTFYTLESFPFSINWNDGDCAYDNSFEELLK